MNSRPIRGHLVNKRAVWIMEFSLSSEGPPPSIIREKIFFSFIWYMGSEKCFNAKKFFFLFFSGQWENSGVPTPKYRGHYPTTYPTKGWRKKISLHFWMIQTMFKTKKNNKKIREKEPKSENSLIFFFLMNPSLISKPIRGRFSRWEASKYWMSYWLSQFMD